MILNGKTNALTIRHFAYIITVSKMRKRSRMKKTLKNQKVNATLQFLRRNPLTEAWLKPVTKRSQNKPCKLGGFAV